MSFADKAAQLIAKKEAELRAEGKSDEFIGEWRRKVKGGTGRLLQSYARQFRVCTSTLLSPGLPMTGKAATKIMPQHVT